MLEESVQGNSFWTATRNYQPSPTLRGLLDVDVAVIGGGFSGMAAAHILKKEQPGLRIALLERQAVGSGASSRSGGLVSARFGMNLSLTAKRLGREETREICRYMLQAVDFLESQIKLQRIDCEYKQTGFLRVATSEKYKERLLREMELAYSLGLEDILWIDRMELMNTVRSPLFLGARREPRGGLLNPAKLAWGWKDVIERQGVAVYEQTPVVAIDRQGKKIRLCVPWGEVSTDKLILAMNAYSGQMPGLAGLKRKQMSFWMHAVVTEPLSAGQLEEIGWTGREGLEEARHFGPFYRLTADNRLLIGGGETTMNDDKDPDQENNDAAFLFLERRLRAVFPILQDIHFDHFWGGQISIPMDMIPALGYLGDKNTVFSLGCMGHGLAMAHLNGVITADLILGRRTKLTDLAFVNRKALPWPPEPFGFLAGQAAQRYLYLNHIYCRPKSI